MLNPFRPIYRYSARAAARSSGLILASRALISTGPRGLRDGLAYVLASNVTDDGTSPLARHSVCAAMMTVFAASLRRSSMLIVDQSMTTADSVLLVARASSFVRTVWVVVVMFVIPLYVTDIGYIHHDAIRLGFGHTHVNYFH